MLERVQFESFRLGCPSFADELVRRETIEGLQATTDIVSECQGVDAVEVFYDRRSYPSWKLAADNRTGVLR